MTSRERVEAALQHVSPDRTPVFEYFMRSPVADVLLGRTYAAAVDNWPTSVRELGWDAALRQRVADRLDLDEQLRLTHTFARADLLLPHNHASPLSRANGSLR